MSRSQLLLPLSALLLFSAVALCFGSNSNSKDKANQSQNGQSPPISQETKYVLIRGLNAERVFVRKPFPMGDKGLTIKDGVVTPNDEQLNFMLAQTGPAAKPGDRAQITNVIFQSRSIVFEINGGPKKKKKWYQHLEVGMGSSGATVPVAPDDSVNARGSFVALMFDRYVPDISPDEIKKMLAPVFDFNALSATQAYVDTLPPKAKEAVKNHEVLVGMNREMVVASQGRPQQKIREHDDRGDYEEWIYGQPPQEVEFVRLYGDEVGRVEIMKVNGEKVLRTEKEVDVAPSGMAQHQEQTEAASGGSPNSSEPANTNAPSLRRPGESLPNDDQMNPPPSLEKPQQRPQAPTGQIPPQQTPPQQSPSSPH